MGRHGICFAGCMCTKAQKDTWKQTAENLGLSTGPYYSGFRPDLRRFYEWIQPLCIALAFPLHA